MRELILICLINFILVSGYVVNADSLNDTPFLNGLILDETMTQSGHNFYNIFHQKWLKINNNDFINLTVKEQPGRFRGGLVMIFMQDEIIFKSVLPFKYDEIEKLAETALVSINQVLYNKAFIHDQLGYY